MDWRLYISLPSVWLGLFLIYLSVRFRLKRRANVKNGVVSPSGLVAGDALDAKASILD